MEAHIYAAKELLKAAKAVLADADYVYDPEHRNRPEGGGWEKTEKGWTQKKRKKGSEEKVQLSEEQKSLIKDANSETWWKRRDAASKEELPASILDKLAGDSEMKVREAVAENPSTSEKTLLKLSEDDHTEVQYAVAKNPNTPVKALQNMVFQGDSYVDTAIAQHPRTPVKTLVMLSREEDYLTRWGVAKNPKAPPKILNRLSKEDDYGIRCAVARNPNTPVETLVRLADDEDTTVLRRVVESGRLPEEAEKKAQKKLKENLMREQQALQEHGSGDALEDALTYKLDNDEELSEEDCQELWDSSAMESKERFMKLVLQPTFPEDLMEEAYCYDGAQNNPMTLEDFGKMMDKSSPELLEKIDRWDWMYGNTYGDYMKDDLQKMARERLKKWSE